ncbi:MAG: T9SS type A sorting domain-containing protein [Saprospiraceae bacterium]|nr:T9SS type A sorting domain-containing protein [Saprospiraceae bacterium]
MKTHFHTSLNRLIVAHEKNFANRPIAFYKPKHWCILMLLCTFTANWSFAQVVQDRFGGDLEIVKSEPIQTAPNTNPVSFGSQSLLAVDPLAVYSNVTNSLSSVYPIQDAGVVSGNSITGMICDNLTLVGTPPFSIGKITFVVSNSNASAVTVRPRMRFFLANAPFSKPGTSLGGFSFNSVSIPPNSKTTLAIKTSEPFIINSNSIWAGMLFDNANGSTSATAVQLGQCGMHIYDPIDLGSSTTSFFQTNSYPSSGSFLEDYPIGDTYLLQNNVPANFGWELILTNTLNSITRVNANSQPAGSSVSWSVKFSKVMNGLDADDFSLVETGVSGSTITSITPVGDAPSKEWIVTAATGSGAGSIGLNCIDDIYMSTTLTNTLPFTGEVYTITACSSVTPLVSISANLSGTLTAGTNVTFTATPTNGGATPQYQWKKNNNNVGSNSATYTDATLANNDVITCAMTSNAPCASPATVTSNAITMSICTPPTVYYMTRSGKYCFGDAGLAIGLNNSENGVSYQLQKAGVDVGNAVPGTGTVISFGNQTVGGVYKVIATRTVGGCKSTMGDSVRVIEPIAIVLDSPRVTNVTYNGGNDGSVTISATGGIGTISYSISPNVGTKNGGTFSGLTAQTYIFTATDENGCTKTKAVTVTEAPAIIFGTPSVTNVSCNGGSNGSVTVSATGGTGAISYSISPNVGTKSGGTFSGLTAQTYTFTATDANSNTATITATVQQPTAIVFGTPSVTNVSCNGGSNGSVTVSATGGTGAISYSISPSVGTKSGGTFSGLTAQTYTLTATDANGCTKTTTATVSQPTAIVFGTPSVTKVKCPGGNSGKVVISATGGTGTITYAISPSIGSQSPSGTFNNLTAQTYTFTATDANGCTKTTSVTVGTNVNTPPIVTLTSPANGATLVTSATLTATASDPDGTIAQVNFYWAVGKTKSGVASRQLLGSDNTAPYSYNWRNLAGGNYDIQAEAVDDCGDVVFSTVANVNVLETFTVVMPSPLIGGVFVPGSNLTLTASVIAFTSRTITKIEFYSGNVKLGEDLTAPYSYVWNNVPLGNYNLRAVATDNVGDLWYSSYVAVGGSNGDIRGRFSASGATTSIQTGLSDFALYQNQPNPTANETSIGFNLPKDGQARLTISTIDGRVVKVVNGEYKAGYNSISINKSDLNTSGIFYYRLETAEHSASKKMVVIQ